MNRTADYSPVVLNCGSNVRARRSSGKIHAHSAVTPTAAAPPTTTALTGPIAAAIAPARISPSSFDTEMARPDAALTRPRIWSGVLSWISVPRTKTEKLSFRKYDPVVRKHVEFKEAKIK